ncbi:rhomboid family intramembrane serine protease [Yoonia sp. F2084L]|uniref:rhomboid family intramembrane serine protease n=1 Tax=Yoonia sp. F2084L TaxID=2926419 RepID=UPI001FF16228|nr:rhomboid family intramembrane serine protease [Yoonia sp. F2084L]MCK0095158.1 rhomboid family intramembrane serine protease [Yoonia sp. F2084L]
MKPESPFNALPPVVIALTLLIIGIEAVFQLANAGIIGGPRGVGWRIAAIEEYGFSAAVLDRVLVNGDYSLDMLKRFVTYPFVNVQITQVAFCAALTLALGKFTAEYYGQVKVLCLYVATSIIGAIAYGMLVEGTYPLLGGFTPVYGLIGAYTYALWLRLGNAGENQIMAFRLIGFLLLIQLIFGLIFGGNSQWIAELTGFFSGFVMSAVLAPGGWSSLVARLRERS